MGLSTSYADNERRLRIVGGNPDVETTTSSFSGYLIPAGNPWVVGWNNSDVQANSLIARAVVAAANGRVYAMNNLGVTAEQAEAAKALLRQDPRGFSVLSDEEFLALKSELNFGIKSLDELDSNPSRYNSFKHKVSFLGQIYKYSPEELSERDWIHLTNKLTVALQAYWVGIEESPNNLFEPGVDTYISVRSLLASTLLQLPLNPRAQKLIEKEWLQYLAEEFESQRIYDSGGSYNEYRPLNYPDDNDLDIPANFTVGRWAKEIEALMNSRVSLKRIEVLADMLIRNMSGIPTGEGSTVRHPSRDYLTEVMSKAIAHEIKDRPSAWQKFIKAYDDAREEFSHREYLFASFWAEDAELFEHPVVGEEIREFVVMIFRNHWTEVIRRNDKIMDREMFYDLFQRYANVEEPATLSAKLMGVIGKHFELLGGYFNTDSEDKEMTLKLYNMWKEIPISNHEKLKSVQTLMQYYMSGRMNLGSAFNQEFVNSYRELSVPVSSHERMIERVLSETYERYPSDSQVWVFQQLLEMYPERKIEWGTRYYKMLLSSYVNTAMYKLIGEEDPEDEKRYAFMLNILEQLRQWHGAGYKDILMSVRAQIIAAEKLDLETSDEFTELYRENLKKHVEKHLRLFAAGLPQAVCEDLFDSEG